MSADFNNDGYADLAVINVETNDLVIYTADAIGTLTLSHDYGIFNFVRPNAIVAGDVNGDGKIDLVITDDLGVSILLGVGDVTATFTAASPQRPTLLDSENAVTNPQLADLNHDGKLDIVVGVRESGNFGGTAYFEVLQGIGGGKFILVGQYEVSNSGDPYYSAGDSRLADIDGDGELDLIFNGTTSGSNLSWMKGVGNGQFFAPAPLLNVGNGAGLLYDIEALDVDGDGKVNLLMLNAFGNGVWMAKGNGDGTFQPTTHLYATGIPSGNGRSVGRIIVADVNGDGRLDIVADGYVLLQQANHSFVFNEHIGYSETRMLAAIDLNHDGRADLVTADPGAGTIAIFTTVTGPAASVLPKGSPQSTVFNNAFGQPLSVKLADSSNVPVPNVQVIFSIATVGGVAGATAFVGTTNASGIVSYTPVANGGLGCYPMKATITGLNVVPLFDLCNTGANDLTVTPSSDNQTTLVNTAFGTQLQVQLTDPSNNTKAGGHSQFWRTEFGTARGTFFTHCGYQRERLRGGHGDSHRCIRGVHRERYRARRNTDFDQAHELRSRGLSHIHCVCGVDAAICVCDSSLHRADHGTRDGLLREPGGGRDGGVQNHARCGDRRDGCVLHIDRSDQRGR